MSLDDLGQVVAAEQDARLRTSNAVDRVRERVAAMPLRRPDRRSSSLRWAGAAAAMLAAAAIVVLLLRSRATTAPLTFEVSGEKASSGAWISTDTSSVTAVRFSDGSIFALGEGARARVESVTSDGAHVVMERGSVSADVVHRATSHWSVLAGPYEVHVTGTQFNVSWQPARGRIEVHVTRGSVVVSGGGVAEHPVRTGEDFVFEPDSAEAAPSPPASHVDVEKEEPAPVQATAPTSAVATPRWKELAKAGDYTDAIDAVRRAGVDNVIATSGPSDLFVLADAARLSGHPEIAEKSLLALRHRFPRDAKAPRAAFDLGRLAFDQRHDYADAATWFSTCLKEDPNGPLDREAAGRLIEARKRAGDAGGARAAAREYLTRYPDGPHAPLAKSIATSEP
ncbi:MAG TPA: FecR domain-containing protein [Polyangiaceae bacterium]|nr:FecR domain-containing protein [Polyangiaceae bacterium]